MSKQNRNNILYVKCHKTLKHALKGFIYIVGKFKNLSKWSKNNS